MRPCITIFIVISFIGVAGFGFLGMNHASDQDHGNGCIAITARGINCSKEVSPINSVALHFSAFKNFSLTTLSENILYSLLFLFLTLLFIGFGLSSFLPRLPLSLVWARYGFQRFFSPPQKQKLIHWLAFHENSPAFSKR